MRVRWAKYWTLSMANTANPVEFLQNRFEEAYKETEQRSAQVSKESKTRLYTAYLLKAVAVFGGIAIAAGLKGVWSQVVGILITVAVAYDALSSNHKRLIVVMKATNAYSTLLSKVRHSYNQKLAPILAISGSDEEATKKQKLDKLISPLIDELHEGKMTIDSALQEEDLKLLNSLALEQAKSTPSES